MNSNEREDIIMLDVALNSLDIESLSFKDMNTIITDFILIVLSEDTRLNPKIRESFINMSMTGRGYIENRITKNELETARIEAWKMYDNAKNESFEQNIARFIVCGLYDEDFQSYDALKVIELLYSVLNDIGKGWCSTFTDFLKSHPAVIQD